MHCFKEFSIADGETVLNKFGTLKNNKNFLLISLK